MLDKKKKVDSMTYSDSSKIIEKNFNKIGIIFELLYENNKDIKFLKFFHKIKLNLLLLNNQYNDTISKIKKIKNKILESENKLFEEKKKKKDDEYYEKIENDIKKYYDKLKQEEKELELVVNYYKEIILKLKKYNATINKINSLLNDLELTANSSSLEDDLETQFNFNKKIEENVYKNIIPIDIKLVEFYDKNRIDGNMTDVINYSFINKSIFGLFDVIKGEELFDPLIELIYSLNKDTDVDSFQSSFEQSILNPNKKTYIQNQDVLVKSKDLFFMRDILMGYKPSIFYRKNVYLYIFNIKGKRMFVSLKNNVKVFKVGEIIDNEDFNLEDFFNLYLLNNN